MAILRNRRVEELESVLARGVNDWGEKLTDENKEFLEKEIVWAQTHASIVGSFHGESVFVGFVIGLVVGMLAITYLG